MSVFAKLGASKLKMLPKLATVILLVGLGLSVSSAATFTNNVSIQVTSDPTSSLTSTSGVFTVSCWFRISVPSSVTLSDNMDIVMDRSDGNESANFSYLLRYNYTNNAVEFVTKGSTTSWSKILIQSPSAQIYQPSLLFR